MVLVLGPYPETRRALTICGDIILDIPHAPDAEDASCFDRCPIENSAVYIHLSELQLEGTLFTTSFMLNFFSHNPSVYYLLTIINGC